MSRKSHGIGRRTFLGSGAILGAVGCSRTDLSPTYEKPCPASGSGSQILAQDYTIAASIPLDGNHYYMHDPGMTVLPTGEIFVAAPLWQVAKAGQTDPAVAVHLLLRRSDDGGRTWIELPTFSNTSDGAPFVYGGALYMFVENSQFGAMMLTKSVDRGETWTPPVTIFDAKNQFWNASTPMVLQNGKLYWAVQTSGFRGNACVVAADVSKDLLDAATWQVSSLLPHPPTPWGVTTGPQPLFDPTCSDAAAPYAPSCTGDWWLEPNLVSVKGRLRVILRTILDDYKTASLPIVCDLIEDGSGMHLEFAQFFPAPGGQNKCFILWDAPSALFWMLSNLPSDSQGTVLDWKEIDATQRFFGGPGNERRFLMLSYSIDALNWFPAGCVARADLLRQSFMYPSAAIDGDDLVLISRTSRDGDTQHNADLVTFHRVRNFRALAMNLYPSASD